jgi:uncharacterized membrane protein
VEQLLARLRAPLARLRTIANGSLWLGPAFAVVVAVAAAALLLELGEGRQRTLLGLDLFVETPGAAREALGSIVSATIAATSLVFTGTVVALQLATGQYSPRLLRDVLTDRGIQVVLSGLAGTVVYALVVLRQVPDEGVVPSWATLVAFLLGLGVVGILVYFLQHLIQLLRLETVVGRVTGETLAVLEHVHPPDADDPSDPDVPDGAVAIPARRSGHVQAIGLQALADAATAADVHLRVREGVGAFVVAGTTAAWAWPTDADAPQEPDEDAVRRLTDRVDEALALGVDRTITADVSYGMRHLVDIALRGVSPGVNDPTTAVQCIHQLTRVLVALSSRPLHQRVARSGDSVVVVPQPDLPAYLDLAQAQVLHYGGGDARVIEALAGQLRDVVEAGTGHGRVSAVRARLDLLREDAARRDHTSGDARTVDAALERVEAVLQGRTDEDEGSAG